ncbi:MAG: thiamine pyrophosphate-dependent enzyme [Myxococcota bacterium]
MAINRAEIVDANFIAGVQSLSPSPRTDLDAPLRVGRQLTGRDAIELFESMVSSRHLDLAARALKRRREGFYTIGASGHECNAAVAAAARPDDPAFLHYRSGAFFVQRARQVPGSTPLFDVLLGMVASRHEPIAGGRHKVYGSLPLNIPPQTSTIASHLPKAVGAAFTLARQKRLGLTAEDDDRVVLCSFGDASANHSTACGAFNTAALMDYQNLPCPIVFVCEDNGLGISVRTPRGWIAQRFGPDPGLKYFGGDGLDIVEAYELAHHAIDYTRRTRRPTFLHLQFVRLLGHAGSDVEQLYRSDAEIAADEIRDPVLHAAKCLVQAGAMTPAEVLRLYEETRERLAALSEEAIRRPRLQTAEEVIAPLAPLDHIAISEEARRPPDAGARAAFFERMPEDDRPRHMAILLNRALGDLLIKHPEMLIFGEDVGRKGGVYHVTADLQKRAGVGRVFNAPLDESAILGMALGAGQLGMLPIPEIQYLAYLHNAIDQIRGEACSLQFFSQRQFQNPMVVRIASLAYQKGFGGHFHNDNAIGALRDIPGLIIACPSNGRDAVGMLRTSVAAAKVDGAVVAFLEPIALYMTKDLDEPRDGRWSFDYPAPDFAVPIGQAKTWAEHPEDALTLFSYGNGLWMSLRVANRLKREGISVRVVDLRWLNPLPIADMVEAAKATGKALIIDECRETGGVAEGVMAALAERCPRVLLARVAAVDTYIPLGAAANLVLVQEHDIEAGIRRLLEA